MVAVGSRARPLVAVFACAAVAHFSYYMPGNDHFDRLARARQIAEFGDVPFRDFFDPGYFLTLYVSAFLQRILGDNLLGELLLNVSFMAAGTTVVFALASKASRSTFCGLVAAALMVAAEPRTYDYDKILFYPLGLYACWRYVDRPTLWSLLIVSATTAVAGMFRYDSGLYLGAALMVAIVARHWGMWRFMARRVAGACLVISLFLAPALVFIESTAGLDDAFDQVKTYAAREGRRGSMFRAPAFDIDWAQPLHVNPLNKANALAWLYRLAVGLPIVVIMVLPLRAANRQREIVAKLLSFGAMAELVTLVILRTPIDARMAGVMPLVLVGSALMAGEWLHWLRPAPEPAGVGARLRRRMVAGVGVAMCSLTIFSIAAFVWLPPKSNLQFGRRLSELGTTPPTLALLPEIRMRPIVEYIRECTKPTDRVFVTLFWPELFFFSGRGFAGGLAVVFGDHWAEARYQQRTLGFLQQQSIPIALTRSDELRGSHQSLWDFVAKHYELSREISLEPDGAPTQVWVRRGLPVERWYAPLSLPCYAP